MHDVAHERTVREAIAAHHERWDGNGYPTGQRGEAIPLLGRILALAGAYSNLTLDRPTQPALPLVIAFDRIRAGAGTQFDPALVEPLLDTIAGEALATTWSASSSRAAADRPAAQLAEIHRSVVAADIGLGRWLRRAAPDERRSCRSKPPT